jgi:HPt (histidine-containing phosphotransfer) domain-containing protein
VTRSFKMNAPDPNAFGLDMNDPEDVELVEYFLGELPSRVDEISHAVTNDDFDQLTRIAHQLKGSAPGFGFPAIGTAAASLEGHLREIDDSAERIQTLRKEAEGLISLCQSYITSRS